MVIYERGNAAKQWIFLELAKLAGTRSLRILDLACGDARFWNYFLDTHPEVSVVGVDTDREAIKRGQSHHPHQRLDLRIFDAQHALREEAFDVVVALSAIEHVVHREAFLRTVWEALASGGTAYLNYDVGHFRSNNLKERLMVPVSQALAWIGIEGPYMKRVDDDRFLSQAKAQGFIIEGVRKHNLHPLKGFFRGASDETIQAWVEFEERLNALYSSDKLDEVMWSTTVILKKP